MTVKERVDQALTIVIPQASTRDYDYKDTYKLMESYGIIETAKNDFLDGKITFEEYISLCEKHDINIDSYLETIECNLIELRLM